MTFFNDSQMINFSRWPNRRRGGGDDVRLTRKFTIVDEDGTEDCFVARQPLLCYHLMGNSTRTGSAQTVPFPYHD